MTTQNPMTLSGDTLAANMDRLVQDGQITPADKALIMWFAADCRARNMSQEDMAKQIGYTGATVSRLLNGRYEGNYGQVCNAIRRYKHLSDERGRMIRPDFVETSVWQQVRDTCDLALINQMPAMILGVPQIGKSFSLLEYQRRSEYTVRYVRMPAAPGFRGTLECVADACLVTTHCTSDQLRRRVAKSLDSRTLLIIDELHQLAISAGKNSAMKIMEWIRELHDTSGCGLVVCGTHALEQDLIQGELKGWLEQFVERCIRRLVLPQKMPDADIELVAKSFGLQPPEGEAAELIRKMRINRYVKLLALAGNLARKRQQSVCWDHFTQAYAAVCR